MIQVVCIKQVADTETRVKVAGGKSLDPAGVTWIMNPYDEFAVEQALRVKEKLGAGEVIVVSLGGAGATTTLRNALAMGADRAIHLKTDAAPDPLQVARALTAAVKDAGAQILWFGRQAVDDDAATGRADGRDDARSAVRDRGRDVRARAIRRRRSSATSKGAAKSSRSSFPRCSRPTRD